jgi:hypothetical protein
MGLRLFGWWHRGSAPAGRHARVRPVVAVPGAAAGLVGSAVRDPLVTRADLLEPGPTGACQAGTPVPVAAPAPLPAPVRVLPAVGLVFADGDSVQLAADDPRVRTFRAAAAALLEHTAS